MKIIKMSQLRTFKDGDGISNEEAKQLAVAAFHVTNAQEDNPDPELEDVYIIIKTPDGFFPTAQEVVGVGPFASPQEAVAHMKSELESTFANVRIEEIPVATAHFMGR